MTWASRFVAVPTSRLRQDQDVMGSPKASAEQLRAYMAPVPEVYRRLGEGTSREQFQSMRRSSDPQAKAVGDTYQHLFSPAGLDHRLEAEHVDGKGLVVTRGHHRIEAAQALGIPYVPVHVRAADDRTLDQMVRSFEADLSEMTPQVVELQRRLDREHRALGAEWQRVQSRGLRVSRSTSIADRSDPAPRRERNR